MVGPLHPVQIDITPSSPIARIDVRGPDAPGVLYRLARVIADADLDLVGARVATLGGEVRDVFFVTSPDPGSGSVDERLDGLNDAQRVAADVPEIAATGPRPPSSA
jgi:UTP:GlnB (protein PII) uridylyltransferase